MNFNELMVAEVTELNTEQQEFLQLHRNIMSNGNMAAVYAVEMARGLKEMRDSGKYKAAGFESFGAYAEAACGIKERQAYNYISVIENLPNDFLQSTAKIGISKLALLASMDAQDRYELIEEHGDKLDNLTMKELEKLKKEYESRIQQMQLDFDAILQEKEETIIELDLANGTVDLEADLKRVEDEKAALLAEIEALKNSPAKIDDKVTAELEKKKAEIIKLKADKEAAEKALKEAKEKAEKEIEAVIEKERAAVKAIEKDLELEKAKIEAEAKKTKIAADPIMSEFKAKFTFYQQIGNGLVDIIENIKDENKEKCIKAMMAAIKAIEEAINE